MNRIKISPNSCSFAGLLLLSMATISTATPLVSATVTRVENKATVAEVKGNQATDQHPAAVSDVIRSNNLLQTTSNSRAELQFKDKSIVRVGPNSVFSFDAKSRTLDLQKGEMLFYLVPGSGKATVKTAAVTAAITGTVILVKDDEIFVYEGSMTITDASGQKVTLTAGGMNHVRLDANGNFVGGIANHLEPALLDSSLYSWAVLPDNAERRIAAANPGFTREDGALASDAGNGLAGGGFGVNSFVGLSPSFGSGGSSGATTTKVLADGTIGLFADGKFVGLAK